MKECQVLSRANLMLFASDLILDWQNVCNMYFDLQRRTFRRFIVALGGYHFFSNEHATLNILSAVTFHFFHEGASLWRNKTY